MLSPCLHTYILKQIIHNFVDLSFDETVGGVLFGPSFIIDKKVHRELWKKYSDETFHSLTNGQNENTKKLPLGLK